MTKTEKKKLLTKEIILQVKNIFTIGDDFNDEEGHGYFTFSIIDNGEEYRFDMSRNDFDIITHKVRNENGYERSRQLEKQLQDFINNVISDTNEYLAFPSL